MNEEKGVSLSACVAAFLAEKSAELSPYSVAHLRQSLNPLAKALDDPPPDSVTYADLRGYVDGLYRRYKPGTIRPIVGDIRQFWRWAKKRGHVSRNAAKRLKMPSRRALAMAADPKAAGEDEVRKVIDYLTGRLSRVVYRDVFGNLCGAPAWDLAEVMALRDLFAIVLIYETGARVGEVQALGSRAMDDALTSSGPAYPLVVTGKTGARTLWFTTATAELWRMWQIARPAGNEHMAIVSLGRYGNPAPMLDRSSLSRMIARRCNESGTPPFRAHALRHAKARRSAAAVGLQTASRLLDHSSTAVTEQYAAIRNDELSEAATLTGLMYRLWG